MSACCRRDLCEEAAIGVIVENGLDFPNANTILIDRAHRFGQTQTVFVYKLVAFEDEGRLSFALSPLRCAFASRLRMPNRFLFYSFHASRDLLKAPTLHSLGVVLHDAGRERFRPSRLEFVSSAAF